MKHWLGSQVVVSGLAPDKALYSAPNAASSGIAEIKFPERLDEALRYAVARVEKDPQNVEAIVRHLGWDGKDRCYNDHVDPAIDLPHQHLQNIVARAIAGLRSDGIVPEVVERAIALIERMISKSRHGHLQSFAECKALLY